MRTLSGPVDTAFAANVVAPFVFFEMQFGDGTLRLHLGEGDVIWGGFTWQGMGRVVGVEALKENESGAVPGFSLSVSGAISAYISEAMSTQYKRRTCAVYVGVGALPDLTLLDTPVLENDGKMDTMPIRIEKDDATGAVTATVAITVENELFDFDRPNPWMWSNEAQQKKYPGDKFLEYVSQMSDRQIVWPNREWYQR